MDKMKLSGKQILVTGGNGYLGSELIDSLLKEGANVYSFDLNSESNNPDVIYCQLNLLDKENVIKKISEIQPEFIYHLAANLNRTRDYFQIDDLVDVNLKGTNNLLTALIGIDYNNFIFTSTSEVYGGSLRSPFKENKVDVPASPYGLSKYCAEKTIQTFSNIYNKNYTILRLFNFFGAGMSQDFFIPQLVKSLKKNIDFNMTKGSQIRDFIFIDDVINSLIASLSKNSYDQVFNVCSNKGVTMHDLAIRLRNVLGSTSTINFGAIPYRENEIWEMVGDNTKIREMLGVEIDSSFLNDIEKWVK